MEVWRKQTLLAYLGYYPYADIDNAWGEQTQKATEAFQRDYQITVDGIFGNGTLSRILEVISTGEAPTAAPETPAPDSDNGTQGSNSEKAEANNKTVTIWDEIKYFTREEFRCQCYKQVARYGGPYCNGFPVEPDETLLRVLDEIRRRAGVPISIVDAGGSGIRCQDHNAHVGGVANSEHKYGRAADLHPDGITPAKLHAIAVEVTAEMIPGRGGIGLYSWGVHVDVGKFSRWNG